MSTREVADYLGLAEQTVRYWRHVGKGPQSFLVGRCVRYRRTEVERWIKAQEAAERQQVSV